MILSEYAYAKINTELRITGIREDGYHLLDMVMQTVSLADTLTFELRDEPGIELVLDREGSLESADELSLGEDNLIRKAAERILMEHPGLPRGLRITLQKRIPMGAGIGGGSADGAAALRGLNRLYGLGMDAMELETIGVKLGADIPFLISGGRQQVRGIGEQLTPLPEMGGGAILIVKPTESVSTPWAYREYDRIMAAAQGEKPGEAGFGYENENRSESTPAQPVNDLELAVLPHYPVIAALKRFMTDRGASLSLMSGSGSAVFGVFETVKEAEKALAALEASDLVKDLEGIWVTEPVARYS